MTAQELLEIVLPRLEAPTSGLSFLEAVRATTEIITERLWDNCSDLLRADFSKVCPVGNNYVSLGDRFLGMHGLPWIVQTDGSGKLIWPLKSGTKHQYTETGPPEFHELRGSRIYLYPAPDEDVTIAGEMYRKPESVESLSDDIPFFGVLDQVYIEAVVRVSKLGPMLTVTKEFSSFLADRVEDFTNRRPAKTVRWRQPV